MEKYINMNDSFGGKNSVSSTKSFQTSYEQCIQNLKQQVQNHKKALKMAEQLIEHYKQQNQRLLRQIQKLKQGKDQAQQKYEFLQKSFLKFDRLKQKELKKQAMRSHQKYALEVQNINFKYENCIATLNQRVFLLEKQLKTYQIKEKQWLQFERTIQKQQNKSHQSRYIVKKEKYPQRNKNMDFIRIQQSQFGQNGERFIGTVKNIESNFSKQGDMGKSRMKNASSSCGNRDNYCRESLSKKDSSLVSKGKKVYKTAQFMRVNTNDDYYSQKQEILNTVNKNHKYPIVYDNFLTQYKQRK